LLRVRFLNIIIIVLFSTVGCHWVNGEQDESIVARVGENYLYQEDISSISKLETGEDSINKVQVFVDNWVKEQLLLQKAKQNLAEHQLDFEKQMDDYRKSLIIYAYENELVKQKLDTNIKPLEIEQYYQENQSNFELREPLYKAQFVKFINSAPQQDSLKIWFFDLGESEKLSEYCTQFALNCQLDNSRWLEKSQWKQFLPKDSLGQVGEPLVGNNTFSDSTFTVLIKVEELKWQGEVAPIAFVREQIKSIIQNQRRLKLITDVKQEIYEEATLKKKYEVYE
jgi:hypothetical protein